jgi:hypothetical protein
VDRFLVAGAGYGLGVMVVNNRFYLSERKHVSKKLVMENSYAYFVGE